MMRQNQTNTDTPIVIARRRTEAEEGEGRGTFPLTDVTVNTINAGVEVAGRDVSSQGQIGKSVSELVKRHRPTEYSSGTRWL